MRGSTTGEEAGEEIGDDVTGDDDDEVDGGVVSVAAVGGLMCTFTKV